MLNLETVAYEMTQVDTGTLRLRASVGYKAEAMIPEQQVALSKVDVVAFKQVDLARMIWNAFYGEPLRTALGIRDRVRWLAGVCRNTPVEYEELLGLAEQLVGLLTAKVSDPPSPRLVSDLCFHCGERRSVAAEGRGRRCRGAGGHCFDPYEAVRQAR